MKRQAHSAFARPAINYKLSARNISTSDAKRKRRDELNYTAHTIRQALEDAGRPPIKLMTRRVRALPISVNTDGCTTISSAEYDKSIVPTVVASSNESNDTQDGVNEMMLYATLVESTRHCYKFKESTSLSNPFESIHGDQEERGVIGDDNDEDEELRASSDTTSTWAPSFSCNQVNLNDKKIIDNDNRSDGTSSNPASSGGEETSDISLSDQCEGEEETSPPNTPENNGCENIDSNNVEAQGDNDCESKGLFVVG